MRRRTDECVRTALVYRLLVIGTVILFAGLERAGAASNLWVAATTMSQAPQLTAYASVQSSGLVTISAAEAGIISGFKLQPGQRVAAGQIVAELGGPQVEAATVQAETAVASSRAAERAAAISLASERDKLKQHLSTNQQIADAQGSLEAARAQAAAMQANLDRLTRSIVLRSPCAGVVQMVAAANGDLHTAGQAVVTVQPDDDVWLKAVFYGLAATDLTSVTSGSFKPAGEGAPVKVSVRGTLGVSQPDGGVPVALTAATSLMPGEFGTVTLKLPQRMVTMIPTDALILDNGRWWVMMHRADGDHAVAVEPGPAAGFNTVIRSGLRPGDEVVVVNAYLLNHRGIAALYQPSD